MGERDAWSVLASVDWLGPVAFAALLARYGTGMAILREASAAGGVERLAATPALSPGGHGRRAGPISPGLAASIADATADRDRIVEEIRGLGLSVVTVEDDSYPRRLAAIEMPPHVLFVAGDPAALERERVIAIVGTRYPSDGGRVAAERIARAMVAASATVVSGLALGIDGAAHVGTLRAEGRTVAVIGSGHAVSSPRTHDRLAERILASGGAIVSELAPHVPANRGTFPRRNRIISGLSDATVVVEAPARSGALITASWALEQGRECFLVPGPIDEPASAGCLSFLRDFHDTARVVAGVPQLVEDLGWNQAVSDGATTAVLATLAEVGETAARLGRAVAAGPATVDELVAVVGWPVATVLAGLTILERHGLVASAHGRYRPTGELLVAIAPEAKVAQRRRTLLP